MGYVLGMRLTARPGEAEDLEAPLVALAAASRTEPGCVSFTVARSTRDRDTFFICEHYADEAAFRAHLATDHFRRLFSEVVVPRVEAPDGAAYVTLDE